VLKYLHRYAIPSKAAPGVGYVYVIGFDGPGSYVKVGSTAAPQDRLLAHLYAARSRGLRLAGL
jgi:hypothetical protein